MNRKVFMILFNTFLIIKCEDNSNTTFPTNETQSSTTASTQVLLQNNVTAGIREGKQDLLGSIVEAVVGAAQVASAVATASLVDSALGNQVITTGEYCGYRRSNRFCDDYCHDSYRGPTVGFCRAGICVCECDYYQCQRYCRRYWNDQNYEYDYDYDYDYDYPRRRYPLRNAKQSFRRRASCSLRGCICD